MATTIITDFDSIYLTSHLPEEVEISTEAARLEIRIYVGSFKVFTSIYYPFNETVIIRDIRDIVEAAMLKREQTLASLKIEVYEPTIVVPTDGYSYDEYGNIIINFNASTADNTPVAKAENIKMVFSSFKVQQEIASFLQTSFLTTRKSALVPRNGSVYLSNFTRANAVGTNFARIFYSPVGSPETVMTYDYTLSLTQATTERIVTTSLRHGTYYSVIYNRMGIQSIIRGVEYHIGSRQFNVFFTDEQASDVFTFRNAFNVEETVYLFGATTVKTEVDRSEAMCGRVTQFYDETVKIKHEVETAPLPYDEALWLNQMLTSKYVTHPLEDGTDAQILISDISSEVTDSSKDLIRLKFSWKYADGNERL